MKKSTKNIYLYLSLSIISLLAGCESIPPGTAPLGSIVPISSISDEKPIDKNTAINTMVTILITTPMISSSDKTPVLNFRPNPLTHNESNNSNYSFVFNNLTLNVYKKLLSTDLILAPSSLTDFDYSLVSTFRENPIFPNVKDGCKVFYWQLALYSSLNENDPPVWTYSLNVVIPEIEEEAQK